MRVVIRLQGQNVEFDAHATRIGCNKDVADCKKRWLNGSERLYVAEAINEAGGVEKYVAESGESIDFYAPERSTMYSPAVLRNAKSQLQSLQKPKVDPIHALRSMQCGSYKDIIREIGCGPVYVEYCTNNQIAIVKNCRSKGTLKYSVDSTGLKILKVVRPDGSLSASFLFYLIVATCIELEETFVVGQMITEVQKSCRISSWLNNFSALGAPHPQEAVCDESMAILNAFSFNYAGFPSIYQYSNFLFHATYESLKSTCYIRIDVAHFMKKYADFLAKNVPLREVRIFYMCVIAYIIKQCSKEAAEEAIFSFFAVALSPHIGTTETFDNTLSKTHLHKLNQATEIGIVLTVTIFIPFLPSGYLMKL